MLSEAEKKKQRRTVAVPGRERYLARRLCKPGSLKQKRVDIFARMKGFKRAMDGQELQARRRTSSMKPSVAAERSSARQARLSGTLIAGRPLSVR